MSDAVDYLRGLATHFEMRDWEWTRLTDIKHIRYADDYSGYHHPWRRLCRAVETIFRTSNLQRMLGLTGFMDRMIGAYVDLRTEKHLPDGHLDGGGVICHWEETGEYLQMVQPSVGAMLADWLDAEPESPHAVKIRAELQRISDGYSKRIHAGEVDGRKPKT